MPVAARPRPTAIGASIEGASASRAGVEHEAPMVRGDPHVARGRDTAVPPFCHSRGAMGSATLASSMRPITTSWLP